VGSSGVAKGGGGCKGPRSPPIFQTKHKHTLKLHEIGQFGQLKNVATRSQFYFKLRCTKFDFGCGSAPDPAGGAHSAPPDP